MGPAPCSPLRTARKRRGPGVGGGDPAKRGRNAVVSRKGFGLPESILPKLLVDLTCLVYLCPATASHVWPCSIKRLHVADTSTCPISIQLVVCASIATAVGLMFGRAECGFLFSLDN